MEEYYYLVNIRKCINFFVIKHIFLLLIPGIPFALVRELQPLSYEEGSQMKMIRLVLVLVMVMLGQLSFAASSVLAQTAGGDAQGYFIGQVVGFIAGLGCVFAFVRWLMRRQKEGGAVRVGGTRFIYTVAILVAVFIVFRYFVGTPLSQSARLAFASGFERTCFSTQRSLEENFTFNDSQLREWCSCVASSLSGKVTKKELKYIVAYETFPGTYQEKSQQAGEQCSQELVR